MDLCTGFRFYCSEDNRKVILHSAWCLGENHFGELICKDGSTRVVFKFIMDALSNIIKPLSKEYPFFLKYIFFLNEHLDRVSSLAPKFTIIIFFIDICKIKEMLVREERSILYYTPHCLKVSVVTINMPMHLFSVPILLFYNARFS